MAERIRFGEYEFDRDTGELSRAGEAGTPLTRLPPQPARLLCLLVDAYPEAVTRETIRRTVWPDSDVEFDRSLHFCVRQVRSALGDSASSPEFVETIPRRGYRWMKAWSPVSAFPTESATPTGDVPAVRYHPRKFGRRHVLGLAALVLVLGSAWGLFEVVGNPESPPVEKLRVAVMSFESESAEEANFTRNDIAERLVQNLTGDYQVVGPSSTALYESPLRLRDLYRDYRVEYILNGRFTPRNGGLRLLAEVIRADDGAHAWARFYEPSDDPASIANDLLAGLRTVAHPP